MSDIQKISPDDLFKITTTENVTIIDVREKDEYKEFRSDLTINQPLSRFDADEVIEVLSLNKNSPVYVVCRSGKRSMMASQLLVDAGLKNVINVEGGMLAWRDAGLPVVPAE